MSDKPSDIHSPTSLAGKELELWHFALKLSDTGLWHWDLSSNVLFWSDHFKDIMGVSEDEFRPHSSEFFDRVHPEDTARVTEAVQSSIENKNVFNCNYRLKHNAGHYLWLKANGRAMYDEDGTPLYMVGSVSDISDSVKLQEELRRSKDELRLIFDNVPVRIWYKDDKNRILRLNKQAADSMNMSVEDAEGKDTYDLFPESAKKYHDDDLKVINSGKSELGIIEEYTPLEGTRGWVRTDKIPYTYPKTGERAVLVTSLDMTEQKEVELSLKESVERFELAVAGASVGIWDWVMSPEENIEEDIWWSQKLHTMFGFSKGEIKPSFDLFMSLIHPADRDAAQVALSEHIDDRKDYSVKFRIQHATEGYKWVLASGQAQWSQDGQPTRMVGSLMDIDELKRTQISLEDQAQKLEASNADLEQFAYVASHDLKAPLRGLDNLAQWIVEDLGDDVDEDIKEKLNLMQGRVARMEALLADILAYSRAGSKESPPEDLDLTAMVHEIIEWVNPPETFTVEIEGTLPKFKASRTIMEHVLLNLISNAIKHNDKDSGFVKITCQETENMIEISIIDDGPGIALEHQEQIFQMFTTLKARDKVEGSGVGLAVVKKMLKSVGQEIWVESPGDNGGSVFRFTMPKA